MMKLNNIDIWVFLETHYEIVRFIETRLNDPHSNILAGYNESGMVYLYNLAARWSEDFEEKYKDNDWSDDNWLETLIEFLHEKESDLK